MQSVLEKIRSVQVPGMIIGLVMGLIGGILFAKAGAFVVPPAGVFVFTAWSGLVGQAVDMVRRR